MKRVLVTDARRGSAVSIIRSLGRGGAYVLAADSERTGPGLYSRFARERVVYPDPLEDPDGAVAHLLEIARTRHVDAIIPVTDELALPLAAARESFAGICRLALPSTSAFETMRDKQATLELAATLGVPTPSTILVHTPEEARAAAGELGWPLVLKPRVSRIYRRGHPIGVFGVRYAEHPGQLPDAFADLTGRSDVLAQRYVAGVGHGVELLLDEGRVLAAFQHRRLREVPFTGGASAFRESVALDPTLFDYSVRLLESVGWTGLAMVEFKVGENGASLMEVNGRIWGSLPLAVRSGVDFPWELHELLLGEAPAPGRRSYRLGTRSRNLELELAWIGSVLLGRGGVSFVPTPPRRRALEALARLPLPVDGYDVQSLHDPVPGLLELGRLVVKPFRKLVR